MGATNSSTMKNTITTNVVNDFMQNISTELETSNSAEMDLAQELQFNMPNASLDGCNIDISQRQNGTLKATLDVLADISDEQEAELVTQITNAQEQALDQANEDLAVGLDNEANTENEISQTVENSLRMSIEKTFTNMNYIRASGSQKAQIDLEGLMCIDSDITVDQNQQMAMVAENLSETISDSVQDGEAVSTIVNEQSQVVSQTNTGMGTSSSGSSCSSSVLIVGAAVAAAVMGGGKGEDGGMPGKSGKKRGGAEGVTPPSEGINWGLVIGILVVGSVILAVVSYIVKYYTPEYPCPSEEECSKGWDDIGGGTSSVDSKLLRKYHNCRIRHRARGIKPRLFRPTCETYCAYATREAGTPGFSPNPLKWLFCIGELFESKEEEEEEEEGGATDGETDGATDGAADGAADGFQNYKPKEIPEGYGNYY